MSTVTNKQHDFNMDERALLSMATKSYFKPKWGTIHTKAVKEFEKEGKAKEAKTIDEIVSVFFK